MNQRFDGLTRAMATGHSRRSVLKMIGGAAAAATAATVLKPFRASGVAATCSGPTNLGASPCAAGTTPCGPCCCQAGIACLNNTNGVCGCPSGTTQCGSACCQKGTACANASTSTCATAAVSCTQGQAPCGKSCCSATGQVCVSGTCTACIASGGSCAAGASCCTAGQACINNICQSSTCSPYLGACASYVECCSGTCGQNCGCIANGKTCTTDAQCCEGLCSGGVCETTPDCFVGTTPVLMADGSERAIEEIEAGDVVLGSNGEHNMVLGVLRLALGARDLWALNGYDHFVTASHPFLTADGWKSIDPARTAKEHPAVDTAQLRVGDRVLATEARPLAGVCGNVLTATTLRHVAITKISRRLADPALRIYNLTVDGDHTYFANGFVVHNK